MANTTLVCRHSGIDSHPVELVEKGRAPLIGLALELRHRFCNGDSGGAGAPSVEAQIGIPLIPVCRLRTAAFFASLTQAWSVGLS